MNLKVGIISQARMGSTRLPGKILKTVNDVTLLEYHIAGLKKSSLPIIIATTTLEPDNQIAEFATKKGIPFFRGDEKNVLSRYYYTAKEFKLDIVVRVTSDCPLVNGTLIEEAIQQSGIMNSKDLYVSNALKRTFPRGFDFEIFSFNMLEDAFKNATQEHELEHVTPYIYKKALEQNKTFDYLYKKDASEYRLTVDTIEDFRLIETLIKSYKANELGIDEIIAVLENNPELKMINADIKQKSI